MNIIDKIDNYLEEKNLSISMYDIEPSKKAVADAKKILKKAKNFDDIKSMVQEFTSPSKFNSPRGSVQHRRGIINYLLKQDAITKNDIKSLGA